MRALLAVAALALYSSVTAHEVATDPVESSWRAVDARTGQIRDIEGLEQLARDFPDSGTVRLRMLQPYLAAGEVDKVIETLEWLYDRGYVFSEVAKKQIPKLLESVDSGRIAERLRAEAEVIAASEVIAVYPAESGLLEGVIAFPPDLQVQILPRPEFLATSVTEKAVAALLPSGIHAFFSISRLDNVSGMVWDPTHESLWLASGNIVGAQKGELDEFDINGLVRMFRGGREGNIVQAPDGVNPSDLALGVDGTLYTSDPLGGGVYFAGSEDTTLQALVPPGTFRSPQGLATSEDGSKLYVSDYRYGIAIVDLATRKVSRLATNLPLILDGVDGLWRYKNELIVVQNGTSPMRIAAFELSEDGTRVVGHRVLEQAHPEWTEPLSGSIDGDALLYVGNGQWDRYVQGEPAQGKPPLPTQIRRLPLD